MTTSIVNGSAVPASPETVGWLSFLFSPHIQVEDRIVWLNNNWTLSFYILAIYISLVFLGPQLMKNRRPIHLKWTLVFWNFFLAGFSICGFLILGQSIIDIVSHKGFHLSTCGSWMQLSKMALYMGFLFNISKVVELGDTIFLVLRKRPISLLHWYHHTTVMIYVLYASAERVSMTGWFGMVNFGVHSVMYTYYGLSAAGFKVPRPIAMSITITQIIQMVVGIWITLYVYRMNLIGIPCEVPNRFIYMGFLMYLSYFILFGKFFFNSYMNPKQNNKKLT